jgi:hypothetical protein
LRGRCRIEVKQMPPLLIGAALLAASVLTFVIFYPRGGNVHPLLASESTQSMLMMILIVAVCTGAALMLFGYPTGLMIGK